MDVRSIIGLKRYSKKFDKALFDHVDISLNGRFVSINGDNGCGKTTIMKEIYANNSNRISYIEQGFKLFENATGKENIELIDKNIDVQLLKQLGIDEIYDKRVSQMSAGERQRIVCYIALKTKNEWLFIDEIDNHLDVRNAKNIYNLFKDNDCNILAISHHKELLMEYSDQVIEVKNGRIENFYKEKYHKPLTGESKVKKMSLIRPFIFKCAYLIILFLNICLCSVCIYFSNIRSSDISYKYYSDSRNLQVEPILYFDGCELPANYNMLTTLSNIESIFHSVHIDIFSVIGDSSGVYVGDSKLKNGYLSDLYDECVFDVELDELEVYLSSMYKNDNLSFKMKFSFVFNDTKYQIDLSEKVKIKGYIDLPADSYVYSYDQLVNIINNKIRVEEIGLIDILKESPEVLSGSFNAKYIGVLNVFVDYEDIGKHLEYENYTLYLYSLNLLKYKNDYKNYTYNKIIYNSISGISIFLMIAINIYYIEYFIKKKKPIFHSFYNISNNKKETIVIRLLIIFLLLFPIISFALLL